MGTKRQHEGDEAVQGASSKRQRSFAGRKRKAQEDSGAKKRARAIERSLRRNENLPADIRSNLERELASQKQIAEDKAYKTKRSNMISRYHMVRFFERKKASRLVRQLEHKLGQATDPDEKEKMSRDLHVARVDEAYTQYFPHLEAYISLYGASARSQHEDGEGKKPAAKAALEAERPAMWSVVEKAMLQGTAALETLRDRRGLDDKPPPPPPPPTRKPTTPSGARGSHEKQDGKAAQRASGPSDEGKGGKQPELNRRERRRLMREAAQAAKDEDEEEGGGFFEGL